FLRWAVAANYHSRCGERSYSKETNCLDDAAFANTDMSSGTYECLESFAGLIYVEDEIREDAAHVVQTLTGEGINVYLLSGDKKSLAEYVASVVGIPKNQVSLHLSILVFFFLLAVHCLQTSFGFLQLDLAVNTNEETVSEDVCLAKTAPASRIKRGINDYAFEFFVSAFSCAAMLNIST
ncbi:copper-transporting ATPase PAA1, chloroplastic, partial [Tanacetum coccineum]